VNNDGPLSPGELLILLRGIAEHGDFPDAVQADARDYLQSVLERLEATLFGSGSVKGEPREVVGRLPRPRCGS
jgi:hypothetical protein